MKRPFRLKDPVTGLYYCPSRKIKVNPENKPYGNYVKSNLSKKGKIYFSAQKLEKHIFDHVNLIEIGVSYHHTNRKFYGPSLRTATFIIEYIQFEDENTN